jgi:hypothetical protein
MDLRARTPARRLGEAITTLVFALALALPMGGRVLDEGAATSTLAEQRSPAPLPEAPTSPRGLLRIPREFDAWLNDGFGFRRFLIRGHNAAKLFLFRTTPTEQLLLGDDLWLYTTGNLALEAYRGAFRLNEAELELWRRTLEDRRDWLAARGIQYVFLVAPDKADVYPEQLPSSIVRAETTTLDQLIAHMRARSDFRVLEIRAPLLAAKADDREHDFLYYPQGTHWSDRGAYVGYVEILRALRDLLPRWADDFEPWPRGDFERVVKAGVGDGWEDRLHLADVMRQRNVRLIPRRERRAREVGAERGLDGKLYEIPGSELPRGLMLHDSFGALLREPLAEHFSYFHTANSLDLETELVRDTKPDVVIQVLAERRLAAYRPLGSSLTQGEDLRARFEAAEVVCIELDQAH